MGKVVKGSISHNETLGGLSPAVDSSQPTCQLKVVQRSHPKEKGKKSEFSMT